MSNAAIKMNSGYSLAQDVTRAGRFTKLSGRTRNYAAVLVGHEEGRSQDLRIPAARPRNVGHSRLAGLAGDTSGRVSCEGSASSGSNIPFL